MSQPHRIYDDGSATPPTAFAPAERATRAAVEEHIRLLTLQPLTKALLEATGVSVVVLNRQRQILVGNATLLEALQVARPDLLEGLRPGEALGCVHAWEHAGGCGTAPACASCGAALAILGSQRRATPVEQECLLTVERNGVSEARELHVRASQVEIGGETFTVVGLRDISAEKRRAVLERVFLHDVANTLTPLLSWAQVLAREGPAEVHETAERIESLARRLRREIQDQRVLLRAESGTLELSRDAVAPEAALDAAARELDGHPRAHRRTLEVQRGGAAAPIVTDQSLLVRVLVNMMTNAFEATPEGGVVRAWVADGPEACELRVWNATALEPGVMHQVFKRSFSTKPGPGRGLGTFSMKLFGERYLGGKVGFTSSPADGTVFFIRLPR